MLSDTTHVAMELRSDDVYRVPETIHFPTEELNILEIWREEKTFERCMQLSKHRPR